MTSTKLHLTVAPPLPPAVVSPAAVSHPLTLPEKKELEACEETIGLHIEGFRKTGEALLRIRDARLYREHFATFELYCRSRWEFSKTHANRLIAASSVVGALESAGASPELVSRLGEAAIRPITTLKPAEQKKVLARLVRDVQPAAGQVPSKVVADVVRKVVPRSNKPRKAHKPGDLIRRSEVLEGIAAWEKAAKRKDSWANLHPREVLQEVRAIVEGL